MQADPGEVHNAVNDPQYAATVSQSREALWRIMQQFGDPYAMPNRYGAKRYLARS